MPIQNKQKRLKFDRVRSRRRRKDPKYQEWSRKYQRSYYWKNITRKRKQARERYQKNREKILQQLSRNRKVWKECINCNKDIFGVKKKKYCADCRKKRMREMLQGNQYWKLVKNRLKGENSPVWKGGITFWKKRIWDSPKYKQWRKEVFERDNYTCQKCGAKNGRGKTIQFEAHHLDSFTGLLRKYNIHSKEEADKCEELWNIDLGQTLCFKCHQPTKNGNPRKKRKNKNGMGPS